MADTVTTTAIKLSVASLDGTKTITVNYANPNATTENIKAFAQALVDNTNIFRETYTGLKSARFVTTETQEIDL